MSLTLSELVSILDGMAKTTGRPHSSRREQILEAALACFVAKGYAATTIEEVREASGASIGSIYHHFGSKEQIAGELYLQSLSRYQEGFVATLRAAGDAREAVKTLVRYHLDWVAQDPDIARFLTEEREPEVMLTTAAPLRELNKGFFMEVRDWLEEQIEAGPIKPLPYDLFYATLMGPAHEFAKHWLDGRTITSIEEAREILPESAWMALRRA